MNISELKPNQRNVSLEEVEVTEISPVKEFRKFGTPGRVCNATIKDDSGSVSLTLWNEEIDTIKEGAKLEIKDAFVKEWQGALQLTTGRNGSIVLK
ncbi:OB-fold nucleic acid binding domain-containing protein [Nanoarchaeota archaeon]